MSVDFDPEKRVSVGVEFESPHVVRYRLWYRELGDERWTIFASGTDERPTDETAHTYAVGPLARESEIAYYFEFTGNPETVYRARLVLSQEHGELFTEQVDGQTDVDGVAKEEGRFSLT